MAHSINKQAASNAGDTLDKAADLILGIAKAAGIKPQIAQKFAMQCDLLSDHIAKCAGLDIAKLASQRQADWDPSEIGKEKSGPAEGDSDESYMNSEFSQQENREMREKQESGELAKGSDQPQKPQPGVQAALKNGQKLAELYMDINKAATRCASSDHEAVQGLGTKLANTGMSVLSFQARMLEGTESSTRMAALLRAAAHVLPHLANDVPPMAAGKLARMADLVSGLAKAA